jgi:GNAT superfamily N-acetyltransferase
MVEPIRFQIAEQVQDADYDAVLAYLREFNRQRAPAFFEARDRPENARRPLHVWAYDGDNTVPVGGLIGSTALAWLEITYLAVHPDHRGRDIGTRLVEAAEREGVARGCRYAFLDTMSYQAGPFYEKQGYALAGRLADWDSHGHDKLLYTKRLI